MNQENSSDAPIGMITHQDDESIPADSSQKERITATQLVDLDWVSKAKLRAWSEAGLPFVQVRKAHMYDVDEVRRWVAKNGESAEIAAKERGGPKRARQGDQSRPDCPVCLNRGVPAEQAKCTAYRTDPLYTHYRCRTCGFNGPKMMRPDARAALESPRQQTLDQTGFSARQ